MKYKCQICGKSLNKITIHVTKKHHIDAKDYYDMYIAKPGEGICEI